jgi:hypothetical protein
MSDHSKVCEKKKIRVNETNIDNKIDDQYSCFSLIPITQHENNPYLITGLEEYLRLFNRSHEVIIHEFFNKSDLYLNTECSTWQKHYTSLNTVKHQ